MSKGAVCLLLVALIGVSVATRNSSSVESKANVSGVTEPETTTNEVPNNASLRILSRKRRYIVFPKGSSIQLVYCENVRTYIPLTKRFVGGFTMGLAWMLPTEAHELYLQKRDVDATMAAAAFAGLGVHHRADLYKVLESLLIMKGLKGRECVLRAVCESYETDGSQNQSTTLSSETPIGSFMEELHKILFKLPVHPKHKTPYDEARKHAGKCGEAYSGCHSFLELSV